MYKLRQHQKDFIIAFRDTPHRGLFAWHEMGLGKTLSALHIAKHHRKRAVKASGYEDLKTLVLCPKNIVAVWEDEIAKWCPQENKNIIVISYTQMHNNIFGLKNTKIGLVILDEFHHLRNPDTQRLRRFATLLKAIYQDNINLRFLGLSGTPLVNSGQDLYSLWAVHTAKNSSDAAEKLFDKTRRYRWLRAFCEREEVAGRVVFSGLKNGDKLKKLLGPIIHKRTLAKCVDMPEKSVIPIDLGLKDDKLLSNVDITNPEAYMSIVEALSRAKTPHLMNWVEEFVETHPKEPLIVFAMHRTPLKELAQRFGEKVGLIDGDTTQEERDDTVRAFKKGKMKIIGISYTCGAEGLNLQHCRYAVYHSYPWTAGTLNQAIARIHRPGQESKTVHYILTSGENDRKIMHTVLRKQRASDSIGR